MLATDISGKVNRTQVLKYYFIYFVIFVGLSSKCKILIFCCFLMFLAHLTLILPRSRTGTVWFYTSTSNKGAARSKLYTKSLTGDLKRMYSRLTLVRISIKL